MKFAIALFATAALLGANAVAGPESIIKQRAKETVNQNNVRQGVAAPVPPTAATPAQPAAPALSPAITAFQAGLGSLRIGMPATADQSQKLTLNLVAAAQGAKPAPATASKFVEAITAASVEKPLSAASRARLVRELDAVLNPGKYPNAKLDGIFADVQAIFQENGLSRNKAVALVENLKAVSVEIQRGGA